MKFSKVSADQNIFFLYFIFFLGHLFFVDFSLVNDEFIFPVGSNFINTLDIEIIKIFFEWNSNTLGFSLLISLFNYFFYFLEPQHIAKFLSYTGFFFLLMGLKNTSKYFDLNQKQNFYLCLIVILNPIIWVYTFRGIPDFLSVSLSYFSIFGFFTSKKSVNKFFYIIIFSIAVILKPFNSILILFIFLDILHKKNYDNFIFLVIFLIIITIYFFTKFQLFNFILVPDGFKSSFKFNIFNFLSSFISYSGYLFFFIGIFFVRYIVSELKNFKFLIYLFFLIIISYLFSNKIIIFIGELDLGFLTKLIDVKIYKSILLFNSLLFFSIIFIKIKKIDLSMKYLLSIIFIFIFIMSTTHIAQRYLMIIIPLAYIFSLKHNKKIFEKNFIIVIFVSLNFISFGNYYNNNYLIKNTLSYLLYNKLTNLTSPGYIGQHSLHKFTDFYTIINGRVIALTKDQIFKNNKIYNISVNKPQNRRIVFFNTSNYFKIFKKDIFVYEIK